MKKWSELGKEFMRFLDEVDIFGLSAQLAYFFLLSLFPFLLFLLNLIGYLPIDYEMVLITIGYYAPKEVMDLITTNLEGLFEENSGGLLSIGIIGTLWAASNAINAIMKAFNKAYRIEESRKFLVNRLIAIILTIAMVLVIVVALLLPVFGRIIGEHIFSIFGLSASFLAIWEALRWMLSSIIFFVVLLALYKLAPSIRIKIRDALWGAVIGTVLWQGVSFGFSFYVTTIANYSARYGSLGTVIVLMIWFYLFGLIILLGGVINAFIARMRGYRPPIPKRRN